MTNSKSALRPAAELLTVGDELLKGSTLNTNAQYLGRELNSLGLKVISQSACPDDISAIRTRLGEAISRADIIIMTGGLGPTPDDVTRDAVAAYFDVPLKFSRAQYDLILKYFKARKKNVPDCVRKEAMFPSNATPLVNRHGVALGFYLKAGRKLVFVLPGVPREQEKMFKALVVPIIRKSFKRIGLVHSLIVKTVGLSEPAIMQRLGKKFFSEPFDFGIYPAPGQTAIRLQAPNKKIIANLRRMVKAGLGDAVYAWDDSSLEAVVADLLLRKGATVSVAESCTGGMLGSALSSVPGVSRVFDGGVIAYQNEVKIKQLGVSAALLKRRGAVSDEVAKAMAGGVRREFCSTYGVGISGIAGPSGGTRLKPVGTVCVSVQGPRGGRTKRFNFAGDRVQIQQKSVQKALEILWRLLKEPSARRA